MRLGFREDLHPNDSSLSQDFFEKGWEILCENEKKVIHSVENKLDTHGLILENEEELSSNQKYEILFNSQIKQTMHKIKLKTRNQQTSVIKKKSLIPELSCFSSDFRLDINEMNCNKCADFLTLSKSTLTSQTDNILFFQANLLENPFILDFQFRNEEDNWTSKRIPLEIINLNNKPSTQKFLDLRVSRKWRIDQQVLRDLHSSVDTRISETFDTNKTSNKLCSIQKALLLKAYLNCQLENWDEAEISAVDSFRFGQNNKDPEVISHSLVLLAYTLKKKNKLDRLSHILENLLSSGLSEQSPELLFLVALYKLDLSFHWHQTPKSNLPESQLISVAFSRVLNKFATSFASKKVSDLMFRSHAVRGKEVLSWSVFMHFSEDYIFSWGSILWSTMTYFSKVLRFLGCQFAKMQFSWLKGLLDFDVKTFFDHLNTISHKDFVQASKSYFCIIL